MKREDKELLMRDLSCRLPYGVKASTKVGGNIRISFIGEDTIIGEDGDSYDVSFITPYLFPMSSMTDKQREDYYNLCSIGTDECGDIIYFDTYESIDYLNKNKFDYRYLIPMGLAIDATGLNIY